MRKGSIESDSEEEDDEVEDYRQFKVILLGDGAVGKTSIASRFVSSNFQNQYKQTIGLDFFLKSVVLPGDVNVTLQLWDIGGQSIGGKMIHNYIAGAHAVVLCYDISNYSSFENLEDWYRLVKKAFPMNSNGGNGRKDSRTGGAPPAPAESKSVDSAPSTSTPTPTSTSNSNPKGPLVVLLANKIDMLHMRQVDERKVQAFVNENNFLDLKVSAKSGDNVNAAFYEICATLAGILVPKSEMDCQSRPVKATITNHVQHDETVEGGEVPEYKSTGSGCAIS
ncbi:hypothetical protein ScalyP_jg6066 [Parmales sp. scaly parma]|nr:hypothetical protein ScalyP_jg6066 [Parmales sp. scaly parma]